MKTHTTLFFGLFLCLTLSLTTQMQAQNLNVEGDATAAKFIGDGSMLTNIDKDTLNELQALMLSGDTLMLSKDTTNIDLSAFINNWTTNDGRDVAFGYNNLAIGDSSSAMGILNTATGDRSSGIGYFNEVTGAFSSAIGIFNTVFKSYSGAIGVFNVVNEERSSALGYSNAARMIECSAVGAFNEATGNQSSAMGYFNKATAGDAFGHLNRATEGSAFGRSNQATGSSSNAFGSGNQATGLRSSAFGYINEAIADESSAFGHYTISNIYGLMAVGRYNANPVGSDTTWVATEPVFVIGNGENSSTRSTALTILKNGKVGIGDTTPDELLEVNGNVKAMKFMGDGSMLTNINIDDADADASNELQDLSLSGTTLSLTDDATTVDLSGFENNWTESSGNVYRSSGNVGIGTTAPGATLEIEMSTDTFGILIDRQSNTDPGGLFFTYQGNNNFPTAAIQAGGSAGGVQLLAANGRPIEFYTKGSQSGTSIYDTEEVMRIAGNGNVGIGTTDPSAKLEVEGGLTVSNPDSSPTGSSIQLTSPGGGIGINYRLGDGVEGGLTTRFNTFIQNAKFKLNTTKASGVSVQDILVADTIGRVGIGTNSPSSKLDVNGTARIRSLPTGSGTTVVADGNGNLRLSSSSPNVNEQRINDLEQENEWLKAENTEIKARLAKIEALLSGKAENISTTSSSLTSATLSQNAPNPFDEVTRIDCFIPEYIKSASLQVMDQNGRIIKRIPIQATGEGQITLQANLLSAGTYSYSLVLDGQIMETKQMVLTH